MRPSWDEYFMLIAKLVSTRSTCNSRPTGAVLVKDKQLLATGYNGSMPGAPHCSDEVMPDGSPYCYRRVMKVPDADNVTIAGPPTPRPTPLPRRPATG